MSSTNEGKLGTFSTLSIGIGGMVGGGIFAVTGLTVDVTKGAAPIAFLIAGVVALLTSYSYLKLTLRFPGEGGTVEFLNRAFGGGIVTGAANILLLLSYVVLLAVYAYAFGSYGAGFFPEQDRGFWLHVLISAVIVGLVVVNVFGASTWWCVRRTSSTRSRCCCWPPLSWAGCSRPWSGAGSDPGTS